MSDEGEDPSPRPKRKIKKVMVLSSASSSDSDDSGPTTSTRKKRLRVLSEDGSDSSSGSWLAGAMRRRALPVLRDSDADSDTSGWATDHSDALNDVAASASPRTTSKSPTNKASKSISGFSSDSSEGNSEKCSICLMKFLEQEVGTPQTCEHVFCLDCITEWSKNMNTCPVDRITFESIIVRACAGGRVLRSEPVKVEERRPSVEMMIIEDPTVCEVCHNADHEESMLLCDGCDLGYHMQCLTPPLTEIPEDQWLCPNCDGMFVTFSSSSFSLTTSLSRSESSRSARAARAEHQPSTSSGRRPSARAPTAPRGSRAGASGSTRRAPAHRTHRRKYKRRKTVIVEYEVEAEGKFPITKRKKVKTRIKKRRTKKRQSRTAARRTHVRASVRAKLASIRGEVGGSGGGSGGGSELSARRAQAGIPSLSLFGSAHDLDYFEDDGGSEAASTAVAALGPTSSILSAYRQARRKAVAIPSPSHASSAPDLLSNILECQTLLHSKQSIVSVSVDGNVQIKLQTRERSKKERRPERRDDKPLAEKKGIDLTKGDESTRQAPSYPGQGRGWGGGYRYPREQQNQHHNQGYGRGGYDNGYGGGQPPRGPGGQYGESRDGGAFHDYSRRAPQYSDDDSYDRNRRQDNRPMNQRFGGGPPWRPGFPDRQRNSFGGFENPLDMRMGHEPPRGPLRLPNPFSGPPPREKPPEYRPLPQPPAFAFDAAPEVEPDKSEDENESGLVIDTEKYDPMEPTNDDDEYEESEPVAPAPPAEPPSMPPDAPSVESILAGLDTRGLTVSADALDSAVRQALREHRGLLAPRRDSDGDCPNYSIYSATSVHIASDSSRTVAEEPVTRRDSMEDLVQGDGGPEPPDECPPRAEPEASAEKTIEDYAAKVSKRCPITTNTRNPIKIKLNTPSLIRRQVSLYDEEDASQDTTEDAEPAAEPRPDEPTAETKTTDEPDEEMEQSDAQIERRNSDDSATKRRNSTGSVTESRMSNDDEIDTRKSNDSGSDRRKSCDSGSDRRSNDSRSERGKSIEAPKNDEALKDAEDVSSPRGSVDDDATPELRDERNHEDGRTDEEADGPGEDCGPESDEDSSRSGSPRSTRDLKMTESISETEDERSYTPCLDENKSKDASFEDKGLEGLDTEMISEEEANDMFSEGSPPAASAPPPEEGEILDKRPKTDDAKKKKKKEGKKEKDKDRKGKKRGEVTFKKVKGKDRNYRERDKDKEKEKRRASSSRERTRRRKDKRKDLERYDVRTLVSERRRRVKDAFGRDISLSRSRSPSPPLASASPPPRRASSSPPARRPASTSPRRVRLSPSPRRTRISPSPRRRISPSPRRARFSPSPRRRISLSPRRRLSPSPRRRISPSPRRRISPSPRRRISPSPRRRLSLSPRRRLSPSPRRRLSPSPRRRISSSPRRGRPSPAGSPRASPSPKRRRRRSGSRVKATRRRSRSRARKRRRSASPAPAPKPVKAKKKKRARSPGAVAIAAAGVNHRSPRRRSPRRPRARRRAESPAALPPAAGAWSPEAAGRAPSPRTPPAPQPPVPLEERRRRREVERAHRRLRDAIGPSKEVFTSGDNILVSVSFKDQERAEGIGRRERRRERRRRRRAALASPAAAKPVAIIDLERSPFRELTPSPKHVIVLSDDEAPRSPAPAAPPAAPPPAAAAAPAHGPKTPPEPPQPAPPAQTQPQPASEPSEARGPLTPPLAPESPDAYDPYEPTRSASGSPPAPAPAAPPAAAAAPSPLADDDRPSMTLEAAQKTNMSADQVLDRRPLSPIEKVMALLQSTRDVSPEPPPGAGASPAAGGAGPPEPPPAPRVVLPEPARPPPKLFLAKPSPIKSDPIKPMPQATKISRLPLPAVVAGVRRARSASPGAGASPYSPGSSDFGDLFEPPPARRDPFDALVDKPRRRAAQARNGKAAKRAKKGKTTVEVKLDDDNLKILEELPSSAVEMQVKSKFLKKLNRQERVVEEVKHVLKPHYNKKHVSKEQYKHILRRAVPKICHNKTGEINPAKIQALVEAYVKKFRKKRKLGL